MSDLEDRITSDGSTVWVAGTDGSCIGRFGVMGIDIHRTVTDQLEGMGECLLCTHSRTSEDDWDTFKREMKALHGFTVSDRHKPRRFG